jgi:NADPH-dependent FMN reductase
MKVVGFSSGAMGRDGNVDRMVQAIMEHSGHERSFAKLTDLSYSGCKGCVTECAGPKVCRLDDDLLPHYKAIKESDAVVVGSPVYFNGINASMITFLERFFGYRHVRMGLKDKPFVLVLSGCALLEDAKGEFLRRLAPFEVNVLGVIEFSSRVFPCLSCGFHKVCKIGGLYKVMGDEAHSLEITPELFGRWEDDPETVAAVKAAGEKLTSI